MPRRTGWMATTSRAAWCWLCVAVRCGALASAERLRCGRRKEGRKEGRSDEASEGVNGRQCAGRRLA